MKSLIRKCCSAAIMLTSEPKASHVGFTTVRADALRWAVTAIADRTGVNDVTAGAVLADSRLIVGVSAQSLRAAIDFYS
ncbi:hypothetical protein I41_23450 [Lacipirellula limnantheis]|uniref:Uncharacterized protein n=1 Tax=Lacipirellula limnantheis TaxID=2528024 RepID=A0A517TXR7_9BACT|nr:hypothetical protein I41_23450 [Lacipirellula limnantheis]